MTNEFLHPTGYAPMLAVAPAAPAARALAALTGRQRVAAGRAVGRRFRDSMRSPLFMVEAWQLDELSRDVARSRPRRQFVRGVLEGLLHGRPGDADLDGWVWLAAGAFGLPAQPVDAELDAFWNVVNASARFLAGEEFPPFVGNPAAAARAEDAGRAALGRGGPIRRALARRYVAGITPGYRLVPGLGGNVDGRSRAYVRRWRAEYLAARRATGVRDFAAFNFRFGNASPLVMRDVCQALADVL